MRKSFYVFSVALVTFLSAGAAVAGLTIAADGTVIGNSSTPSCVYAAAPGSAPTIAADGTVIAEVKPSQQNCVSGLDYKNMTREQFNELITQRSSG